MRCGCARTGSATNTTLCGSLPAGEVMGAILPKPPSGEGGGPHCLDQKSAFLSYRSGELRSRTSLPPLGLVPRHSFGPALPSPGLREGGAERMPPPLPTSSPRLPPLLVDLGRGPVIQGLVQPPLVGVREVAPQPLLQLRHRLVPPPVD